MEQDKEITKVIFRVWRDDNTCIAIFPELPGDANPATCQTYMHIGQHGAANYHHIIMQTRPAWPKDYKGLMQELERIGYNLKIVLRCTKRDYDKRNSLLTAAE